MYLYVDVGWGDNENYFLLDFYKDLIYHVVNLIPVYYLRHYNLYFMYHKYSSYHKYSWVPFQIYA